MRRSDSTRIVVALGVAMLAGGCEREQPPEDTTVAVPDKEGVVKSAAFVRSERRAYDGAPPVIPHLNFGMECVQCHNERGMDVPGVGYAPPSPHELTSGLSLISNCKQCHVFKTTEGFFATSSFDGLEQDLREGDRLHELAPPVIPHLTFMRENCMACHTGPAAREEIRCDHPERVNCRQCHVAVNDTLHASSRFPR